MQVYLPIAEMSVNVLLIVMISGGIGCLLVVLVTAMASPQLRRFTSFKEAVEAQRAKQG